MTINPADYPGASPAYLAAVEAHNKALEVYLAALRVFREAKVADYEAFASAQRAKKEADLAFDAAYKIEANRE